MSKLTALKRVAYLRAGGTPAVDDPILWNDDTGTDWISIGDMTRSPIVRSGTRRVSERGMATKRLPVGCPGTVLFAMYASLGAVAVLGVDATWNQAILGIQGREGVADNQFIAYWLKHLSRDISALARSNTQDNLNAEQVGNLPFPAIKVASQQQIADFLDDETARIDALIEKKQRMVEVLNQRQQALVDSLLAELPTERLKHAVAIAVSNVDKLTLEGEQEIRLCNYTDVYYNREITADLGFMVASAAVEQVRKFELRSGDVLITKDSETPDDIAVPAYVPQDLPGVVCGYHLAMLRPHVGRAHGEYIYWALRSLHARDQFSVAATGVTRFGLRADSIASVSIPVPPLTVQNEISTRLGSSQLVIDRVCRTLARQVDLLLEGRQTLISAAVTGQLEIAKPAA